MGGGIHKQEKWEEVGANRVEKMKLLELISHPPKPVVALALFPGPSTTSLSRVHGLGWQS